MIRLKLEDLDGFEKDALAAIRSTMRPPRKPRVKGEKKVKQESPLEIEFFYQVKAAGLPIPVRQYKALPDRKFLWDFAWVEVRLLVEVNGMTFSRKRGGHSTGGGIARDYTKVNLGTLAGWRVLIFDGKMIHDGRALRMTEAAIGEVRECNR